MTRLFAGTEFDIPPNCEIRGELETECRCTPTEKAEAAKKQQREADRLPPEKQTARVTVEKRKGSRKATLVTGLTARANDLPELLKQLQAACGTGGTVKSKDNQLELQGDHASKVRETLTTIGFRVK